MNENQKKAVTLPLGPGLVIAGPGSGKTYVIVERINYLINELKCIPNNILVISFTKAASEEMKNRYILKYGNTNVHFGTFHSTFFSILRFCNPTKYTLENLLHEFKKKDYIQKIMLSLGEVDQENSTEKFIEELSLMKNQLIDAKYYNPTGLSKEVFLEAYTRFEKFKKENNLFDFDDMLYECYKELRDNEHIKDRFRDKYKYVLIDEFQDINRVQFETIKFLIEHNNNIFVVGDDDQTIYQFRGAKPEFLLQFEDHFPNTNKVILDINYRCEPNIIKYSNNLISVNKSRFNKKMKPHKTGHELPKIVKCTDAKQQSLLIAKKIEFFKSEGYDLIDMAVIYRSNVQASSIVETFLRKNIVFNLKDSFATLYSHWITNDILSYLKLADDLKNIEHIKRIIHKPSRYISNEIIQSINKNFFENILNNKTLSHSQKEAVKDLYVHLKILRTKPLHEAIKYILNIIGYKQHLTSYAKYKGIEEEALLDIVLEIEESIQGYETYLEWEENLKDIAKNVKSNKYNASNAVTLTTMHSAKGLEFEIVFIIDVIQDIIPHKKSLALTEIEQERRLMYVATTRAKKYLFLYIPKFKNNSEAVPSIFIEEMLSSTEELNIGDKIQHQRYGSGTIENIDNKTAVITFKNNIKKTIDYIFCLKKRIIQIIEEDK
ncbi:hypothetical protein AN639_04055 [Candidatus Epulonipiscium fishelsonii]|uniref:Uncharacterized protein n=1 Tax=Candidatus Epulonipiscium fishelsonii TaxID=77094 RepID=A0ACC8X7U1_9FIRM|nr:hypothetical protein AN396_11725 [Epulopiscium sp. SCG-B11WGA-EpuloA1]ONI41146.1 hypothetical protein AN639_04055 [Epulopiscium sp. SCG-B05WGA-EpuloA1]